MARNSKLNELTDKPKKFQFQENLNFFHNSQNKCVVKYGKTFMCGLNIFKLQKKINEANRIFGD